MEIKFNQRTDYPDQFVTSCQIMGMIHFILEDVGINEIDIFIEVHADYDASVEQAGDGKYLLCLDEEWFLHTPLKKVLHTIAHEMVHVKQYASGRLSIPKRGTFLWEGEEYVLGDTTPVADYYGFPWEVEAYGWERYYFAKYKELLLDN